MNTYHTEYKQTHLSVAPLIACWNKRVYMYYYHKCYAASLLLQACAARSQGGVFIQVCVCMYFKNCVKFLMQSDYHQNFFCFKKIAEKIYYMK